MYVTEFIFTLWRAEGSHQKEIRTFSVVTSEEGGELLAEAGYSCRENGYTRVKQRLRNNSG